MIRVALEITPGPGGKPGQHEAHTQDTHGHGLEHEHDHDHKDHNDHNEHKEVAVSEEHEATVQALCLWWLRLSVYR